MKNDRSPFARITRFTYCNRLFLLLVLIAACSQLSLAQRVYYSHDRAKFTFGGGVGFTQPVERAGDALNTGWNVNLRGGVRVNEYFDADVDFTYSRNNLNDATLAFFNEPDGHIGTWNLTFQPVVKLARRQSIIPYITAGFGLYSRNLTLTEPAFSNTVVCDPFFGGCFPATIGFDQVVESNTTYKPGWNAGGGFEFGMRHSRMKFFSEARYHRMFTNHGEDFSLVPVTFGVRF